MTIDIERLINEIDTDKSGKISYMEFKTLLSDWKIIYNIMLKIYIKLKNL